MGAAAAQESAPETVKEKIIAMEWEMFQRVHNEGGRADCQDRPDTFSIMRRAQFSAWPEELAESYLKDLRDALRTGRNLPMEKYARMMASTAPEEYRRFSSALPEIPEQSREIIEECVAQEISWMEEYCREYPRLSSGNRVLYTREDTPYETSFETYERGELSTYSAHTLGLYRKFLLELKERGENLALLIMTSMVRQYGYRSLTDAENRQPEG